MTTAPKSAHNPDEEEFVFEDDESEKTSEIKAVAPLAAPAPPAKTYGSLAALLLILFLAALAAAIYFFLQSQKSGERDLGPLEAALKGQFEAVQKAVPEGAGALAARDIEVKSALFALLEKGGTEDQWKQHLVQAENTPYSGLRAKAAENRPPLLSALLPQWTPEGGLTLRFTATDPEGEKLTVSILESPADAVLSAKGGDAYEITWKATAASPAMVAFKVLAKDPQGAETSVAQDLRVERNRPPVIASTSFKYRTLTPFTAEIAASDPENTPLRFSLIAGPEGMKLDPLTGIVEWNPKATRGLRDFEIEVRDGINAVRQKIRLEEDTTPGRVAVTILTPTEGQTLSGRVVELTGRVTAPQNVSSARLILNGTEQRLRIQAGGSFREKVVLRAGRNELIVRAESGLDFGAAIVVVQCGVKPSRILATLTWDQEYDADLYAIQPNGEFVYYPFRASRLGGVLDVDNVDGFGPENYSITGELPAGDYVFKVNFFDDNKDTLGQKLAQGPLEWHLRVILDEGTAKEKVEDFHGKLDSVAAWTIATTMTVPGTPPAKRGRASLGVSLGGSSANAILAPEAAWTQAGLPAQGYVLAIYVRNSQNEEFKAVVRNQEDLDMILTNLAPGDRVFVESVDRSGNQTRREIRAQ